MKRQRILAILLSLYLLASPALAGETVVKSVALTVSTTEYESGDCIGGLQTVPLAFGLSHSGLLQNIVYSDLGNEGKQVELCFFSSNPSGSTFTDQGALNIADADLSKVVGCVTISSFSTFNDNGIGQAKNIALAIKSTTSTLYFVVIAREAVTYDATDAVSIQLGILGD